MSVSDKDVYRSARVLIREHGDEFSGKGNIDGRRVWMRIMQAIEELQRERPRDGEVVH